MDIEEFLIKLNKQASKARWYEYSYGIIRTNDTSRSMCPITYLCYTETGRTISNMEAEKAASNISLSRDDAWSIILASDNAQNLSSLTKLKTKAKFDPVLRNRIKEIVGL